MGSKNFLVVSEVAGWRCGVRGWVSGMFRAAAPGGCGPGSALRRPPRPAYFGEREAGRTIAPNFPPLFSLLNRRSPADAKYQLLVFGANTCYHQMTELIESTSVIDHMASAG